MRSKLNLAALAAIAAFGAGTALAQIGPSTGTAAGGDTSGSEFTKLDKDKDGKVSKKEANKNKDLSAKWDTLDVDKDGKLDQAEFARFETTPTGAGESMSEPGGSSSTDQPMDKKY